MFKIKWINERGIIEGISTFSYENAALKQINIWQAIFRTNRYYIIPS